MKTFFFSIVSLFLCNVAFAQAQMNFSDLIESINWNLTESELLDTYPNKIKSRKHYYSDDDNTITNYQFEDIMLGDFSSNASIFVDSISKKVKSLSFNFNGIEKTKDAELLSKEMDQLLFAILGEPDQRKDETENSYVNVIERKWYTDKYILSVNHMRFSDSHIYSLSVKGISNSENDFRVAKWGDSKESVIQKEGRQNELNIDRLYKFSDFVAGMKCDVVYIFTNDKLTMAKYIFNPTHTNKNDYISDYKDLVKLMSEKYGNPEYDTPEWKNSLYKNDKEEYGFAISLGHLSYSAGWFGDITKTMVALYGENYKITLMVQYESEKYKELQDKQNTKDKIKDL